MSRLSHSAVNRYLECPTSYKYHYIDKYRGSVQSSALLYGTAIDKATESYAQKRDFKTAFEVFDKYWKQQEVNGTYTTLYNNTEMVYGNNDLDIDLLSESGNKLIAETYSLANVLETVNHIVETKEQIGFKKLTDGDKLILNHVNWLCMEKKGYLMLGKFIEWFDENVEEVLGTQDKIDLVSGDDSVIGYADLVVKLKGYDKPVILDIKTAGRAYDYDAVTKSPQLALYVYSLKHKYDNTNTAGFVVLHKNILKTKTKICKTCGNDGSGASHKKCAKETVVGIIEKGKNKGQDKLERCNGEWNITIEFDVGMQVLVNEISDLLQENVLENYDHVDRGIKAEVFPRNYGSCIKYGTIRCDFYDICHAGDYSKVCKKD